MTEPGLFEVFDKPAPPRDLLPDLPIREEQVRQLRDAFVTAGIKSMGERKRLIESCVLRTVPSIRQLLAKEVRPILNCIEARGANDHTSTGSAWDNREEDTWIDKM